MVQVTVVTAQQAKADAYVVGVTSKDKKRSAPSLKAFGQEKHKQAQWMIDNETTSLGFKQVQSVPADGLDAALVLVGLGDPGQLTQEKLGSAMNAALAHTKNLGFQKVATTLIADSGMDAKVAAQALTQGAVCGLLTFDQFKSNGDNGKKSKKPEIKALQLIADGRGITGVRKAAKDAAVIAEAVNDARLLANTPANIATPKYLASEARKRGKKHGFKVSVKGRAALRRENFNALCGVAQGSENEEQLITMEYDPPGAKKTLTIMGKGVCFDSGGISLKPGMNMWDMKYDKCGACNVIALMTTLKRLGVKHRVVGVVAAVENMPGGKAQRPGDIVTAKDGTTIEVLNTDAEGRLILADAITYAREKFKPDWMLEMSTLTGACEFAVGKTYVAAMGKDDAFVKSVIESSHRAGDKAWQLPQGEEFDDGNKGTYADIANISLKVKAGTSIGGAFVGHFAKDTTFCHLDIASKAWVDGQDYFPKGPTGAGLRIVVQRILDEA